MPKSNFTIRGFQGGLNGSANQEDVPAEGTPFALNLDPINPRGSLRGIRQDASVLTTEIGSDELILAGHMTVDGKNYTLLATKSGSSVELYTWDGSVVNKLAMPATLSYGKYHTMQVVGKAAFVGSAGRVFWVGNMDDRKQFSGTSSTKSHSGFQVEYLDHNWSSGISAPSITRQNKLAAEQRQTSFKVKNGTGGEPIDVPMTVPQEASDFLSSVEKVFIAYAPVFDGHTTGPLALAGSQSTHTTGSIYKTIDLDATYGSGKWYWANSGKRVNTQAGYDKLYYGFHEVSQVFSSLNVRVEVDSSLVPKRLTAIELYAATASDENASEPDGSYRKVETIHVNDSNWSHSSGTYVFNHTFDIEAITGPTYDADSGLTQEVDDPRIDYRLSCQLDSHLFVTRCDSPTGAEHENWNSYLVKSRPYQFDVFDWTEDFVVLPIEPLALAAFGGRVWAFNEKTVVRVNPHTLEVEDTFEGIGAMHHRAVCVTEHGMFFANAENVFMHDGGRFRRIGDPIRRIEYPEKEGWAQMFDTSNATLVYDGSQHALVCARQPTSGGTLYFLYHIDDGRWSLVEAPFTTLRAGFTDWNLKAHISGLDGTSYKLFRLFDEGSSRRSWTWVSPQLSFGTPTRRHKAYAVRISGDDVTVKLAQNADCTSATASIATSASKNGYHEHKLSSYQQGNTTQIRLEGTGADEVESVGLIHRTLRTP